MRLGHPQPVKVGSLWIVLIGLDHGTLCPHRLIVNCNFRICCNSCEGHLNSFVLVGEAYGKAIRRDEFSEGAAPGKMLRVENYVPRPAPLFGRRQEI